MKKLLTGFALVMIAVTSVIGANTNDWRAQKYPNSVWRRDLGGNPPWTAAMNFNNIQEGDVVVDTSTGDTYMIATRSPSTYFKLSTNGTLTVDAIASDGAVASTTTADGASTRVIIRASIGSDDWGVGTNSLGVTIPSNAVVTAGYVDITYAFCTATNTSTFGFELNSSSDLLAQVLTTNDLYEIGVAALIPVGTASTAVKATDDRVLSLVIEDSPLTNGIATVVLEYDLLAR